jgi:hypothetical protein
MTSELTMTPVLRMTSELTMTWGLPMRPELPMSRNRVGGHSTSCSSLPSAWC